MKKLDEGTGVSPVQAGRRVVEKTVSVPNLPCEGVKL
jgi:hypothetical protein